MTLPTSYVKVDAQDRVTTYVGPDATKLAGVMVLKAALKLYAGTGMRATRNVTITRMVEGAREITGKQYGATKVGAARAVVDLQTWIDKAKAVIPVVRKETEK